jgi:hypothetical protein
MILLTIHVDSKCMYVLPSGPVAHRFPFIVTIAQCDSYQSQELERDLLLNEAI